MIIKAIILETPQGDDNHYKIRIPFFEDHTKNEAEFEALLAYTPGIYNSYSVGDVVFISFENEKLDKPIILGKLYLREDQNKKVGQANFYSVYSNNKNLTDKKITYNNISVSDGDTLNYIVLGEW